MLSEKNSQWCELKTLFRILFVSFDQEDLNLK